MCTYIYIYVYIYMYIVALVWGKRVSPFRVPTSGRSELLAAAHARRAERLSAATLATLATLARTKRKTQRLWPGESCSIRKSVLSFNFYIIYPC